MPTQIVIDDFLKDMCGFHSITTLPDNILCINLLNCFPLSRDQFAHGGKTINVSFKEFKVTFFVSQCPAPPWGIWRFSTKKKTNVQQMPRGVMSTLGIQVTEPFVKPGSVSHVFFISKKGRFFQKATDIFQLIWQNPCGPFGSCTDDQSRTQISRNSLKIVNYRQTTLSHLTHCIHKKFNVAGIRMNQSINQVKTCIWSKQFVYFLQGEERA